MTSSQGPEEARFGLEEVEEVFAADIDDWDDWQVEALLTEALFVVEDAQAALPPRLPDDAMLNAMLAFAAEGDGWGIDEPMTADDLGFIEDDWPEP